MEEDAATARPRRGMHSRVSYKQQSVQSGMSNDRSSPGETIRDRFWIVGPIGLLLAFFWQPALRLIPPFVLTAVASLLVISLILVERATRVSLRRSALILYTCGAALGALGFGEGIYFASLALSVSDANDERCVRIERHMLKEASGRAADAALFQALGCRPQTMDAPGWPPSDKPFVLRQPNNLQASDSRGGGRERLR